MKVSLTTALRRGLMKKCPNCGAGKIFCRWLKMHDHCSRCQWQFLLNQGDLWGALLFIDRALFIFPIVVALFFGVHRWSTAAFLVFTAVLAFLLIVSMPHRNGLAVAVDYIARTRLQKESL